jgi:hypothetical protein
MRACLVVHRIVDAQRSDRGPLLGRKVDVWRAQKHSRCASHGVSRGLARDAQPYFRHFKLKTAWSEGDGLDQCGINRKQRVVEADS